MTPVITPVCRSVEFQAKRRDCSIRSTRPGRRAYSLIGLLSVLFVISLLGPDCFATPAPVQYLGVPTPAITGMNFPIGMAQDASGNIYVAAFSSNAVYKETLQPDGSYVQSTVASNFLSGPVGLAIDGAGNVYVGLDCNGRNGVLLKETPQGNGTYAESSMASEGCVFGVVTDSYGNVYATNEVSVVKYQPSGGSYTSSTIYTGDGNTYQLAGLAIDGNGDVFVANDSGNTIYKLVPSGNAATTTSYAANTITIGTGTRVFGIALDAHGDIFVADLSGKIRLEIADGQGGYTETILASGLSMTYGVTVGPTGTVYVGVSNAIDVFSPAAANIGSPNLYTASAISTLSYTIQPGTVVSAINVVSQGVVNTQTGAPEFVNSGAGSCAAQTYNNVTVCTVTVKFTPQFTGLQTGAVQFLDGSGNVLNNVPLYGIGKAPLAAFTQGTTGLLSVSGLGATPLSGPRHPVMDVAGNLYIADSGNNRVVKVAPGGAATVVSTPDYTLNNPTAVAIDGAGNLYIADSGNARVVEISAQGAASVLDTNSIALGTNYGVAVDAQNNVYTTDAVNNRVLEFPNIGAPHVLSISGVTLGSVAGVAVTPAGIVYIADTSNGQIVKVTNGVGSVLSTGTLSPALVNPTDVAVDAPGNLYITDTGNNRIVEVSAGSTSGLALGTAGYTLNAPACAVTGNAEDLYICDSGNARIVTSNQTMAATLTFPTPNSTNSATLLNLGNLPLTMTVPAAGTNPVFGTSSFTLQNAGNAGYCSQLTTSSEPASIAAGGNCQLSVEFTPAEGASGTTADVLILTDNNQLAPASTQAIALSGTALTTPAVTVTPSPQSVVYGQAMTTVAVRVSSDQGTPTGTVTLTQNNNVVGDAIPLNAGTASIAPQYYVPGTYSFQANYSGDSDYNAAVSTVAVYTVSKATATLSGPANAARFAPGTNGSIAVAVAGQYSGGGIVAPSGSVSYSITDSSNNAVTSGVASIASGAVVIPVAGTMATGQYQVALSYGGDANYNAATAITIPLAITQNAATVTLAPSENPIVVTNAVSFTAAVGTANGTPTGTVAFYDGTTLLGTVTLANKQAVFTTASLTVGTHSITAAYSGDSNFNAATSSAVAETVGRATPTVALVSNLNPAVVTSAVSFTATVNSTAGTPSGTVVFFDGSTLLGTVALANQQAVYTTSSLAAGTHNITAVYSGDDTSLSLTSSAVSELVQDFTVSTPSSGTTDAPSATITPGGTATYSLNIGPSVGTVFPAEVTLSLSGLPPGAIGTLSPTTLPAGSKLSNVTLSIQLPQQTAKTERNADPLRSAPMLLGMLILPFARKLRRNGKKLGSVAMIAMVLAGGIVASVGLTGCASRNGYFARAQQTYTVTVIATCQGVAHSTNVSLTVE